MNKEFEFYHGVVLTRLIHHANLQLNLRLYSDTNNASYVLNNHVGLYIKHSTKRITPWTFNLLSEHKREFNKLAENVGETFLVLVCGDDGIVALRSNELWSIASRDSHTEWISVRRTPRKEYSVKGPIGLLGHKVGKSDFPKAILSMVLTNFESN